MHSVGNHTEHITFDCLKALITLKYQPLLTYHLRAERIIQGYCFSQSLNKSYNSLRNSMQTNCDRRNCKQRDMFCFFLEVFFVCVFSGRLLSVLRGQRKISIPDLIHYIYFPILILEKEPVISLLNVQC